MQCSCFNLFILLHFFDGTFPDNNATDPLIFKRFPNELVSADVVIKLLLPELNAAFRHISVLASAVPMPVTAMNEDGDLIFRKIDVRMSEHGGVVLPVTEALMIQQLSKIDFWLRVFAFDCGHIPASAIRVDCVCHYTPSVSLTKATKRPSVRASRCDPAGLLDRKRCTASEQQE